MKQEEPHDRVKRAVRNVIQERYPDWKVEVGKTPMNGDCFWCTLFVWLEILGKLDRHGIENANQLREYVVDTMWNHRNDFTEDGGHLMCELYTAETGDGEVINGEHMHLKSPK